MERSICDEMNQNNIDFISNIFCSGKNLSLKAGLFQSKYTKSWNSNFAEISQMVYLELSKHYRISDDGAIQVLVELLYNYGLIKKILAIVANTFCHLALNQSV